MKKLIELIKKLLGSSGSSSSSEEKKGFTLIELIIVIAILGILAAAVLAAIDPIDKLRAGNDSKVQSDVRSLYEAAQRTAAAGATSLPTTVALLNAAGELKSIPIPPGGATGGYGTTYDGGAGNGEYVVNAAGDDVVVCGVNRAKANRTKAGASGAQVAYFTITAGKSCYMVGQCAAGTLCP